MLKFIDRNMNPHLKVSPISVKFDYETKEMVRKAAKIVGYSQSKFVNQTMRENLIQVSSEGNETVPQIILMIRTALKKQVAPPAPWKPASHKSRKTKAS